MAADRPLAPPSSPSSSDDSTLKGHLEAAEAERRARRRTRDRWITRLVVLTLGPLAIASYVTDAWWQERERQSELSVMAKAIKPAALVCLREAMSELPRLRRQTLIVRPDVFGRPAALEAEHLTATSDEHVAVDEFKDCLNAIPRPPAREGEPAERLVLEPCEALAAHPLTVEERAATDDGRDLLGDWSGERARCIDGQMRLAKRAQLRQLLRSEGPLDEGALPTGAAAQIAQVGTREALDLAMAQLDAVESDSPATYAWLARAIGRHPLALPWATRRLSSRSWEIRRGAAQDLRHHGSGIDRVALLLPLLDDRARQHDGRALGAHRLAGAAVARRPARADPRPGRAPPSRVRREPPIGGPRHLERQLLDAGRARPQSAAAPLSARRCRAPYSARSSISAAVSPI